jgi:hypothetical protein
MKNLDDQLEILLEKGYTFLPDLKLETKNIKELNLEKYGTRAHIKDTELHNFYLKQHNIKKILIPELIKKANKLHQKNINPNDLYCITKIIKPYQISDSDKPHFDSHLFTLVTPVKIPKSNSKEYFGQLGLFIKIRKEPSNEFFNFLSKLYFFIFFRNEKNLKKLKNKINCVELGFQDMIPVIFLGRQCYHYSMPFYSAKPESHVLLITHFFDPGPKWGIGNINRYLRNR